jgi:hypothetical protein
LIGSSHRGLKVRRNSITQITPPDEAGFCSLAIAVIVARDPPEQTRIRLKEIKALIARTSGGLDSNSRPI